MLEYEDSSYLSKELALTTIIDTLEEEQPKENLLTAPQREKAFLWTSMGLSAGALATVSVLFGLRHSYGIFMVCIFIEVICASVASGLLIYANAKKKQKHIYQNLLLSISLGVCTLMFTICGILPYIIWGANLRNAYEGYYYIVPSVIGLANVAAIWFSMYFGNHVFFGSPAGKKKKE